MKYLVWQSHSTLVVAAQMPCHRALAMMVLPTYFISLSCVSCLPYAVRVDKYFALINMLPVTTTIPRPPEPF